MGGGEYDIPISSGSLKLKKLDKPINKNKRKKKSDREHERTSNDMDMSNITSDTDPKDIEAAIEAKMRERNPLANKTKAELCCLRMQERMKEKRVLDKASKSHKMRVEEFNRHLDNLTEHFDIPKVSWTK